MPDKNGCPTDDELKKLKGWDALIDPMGLIEFLKDIWWMADWGITSRKGKTQFGKKPCIRLYLSTGGWSGNEEIIRVLRDNYFWMFYWVSARRGGHYEFEIPKTHSPPR